MSEKQADDSKHITYKRRLSTDNNPVDIRLLLVSDGIFGFELMSRVGINHSIYYVFELNENSAIHVIEHPIIPCIESQHCDTYILI